MSRSRPPNVSSARADSSESHLLTPRTPHSRSGRAEEGRDELGPAQFDGEDDGIYATYIEQQAEPLLASSDSANFPSTGSRTRRVEGVPERGALSKDRIQIATTSIWHRIPLVLGTTLASVLLVLIVLSIKQPQTLYQYIGDTLGASVHDPDMISYENYTRFPLLATEYQTECAKLHSGYMHHGEYWDVSMHGPHDVPHRADPSVCKSTITYMLDGHVGLLADLALMAQVAAFARQRNRTLLVDDTYWNRGKWIDHFEDVRVTQPGPEPGCRAPPPEELVACPRTARHWVVNSRTAKFHLGHEFSNAYEDPYSRETNRLKPIWDAAHVSFAQTIRPNAQNTELIRMARKEFASGQQASTSSESPSYISVHIRRGDCKATTWKYVGKYIPLENYLVAVKDAWKRFFSPSTSGRARVYVASDSPSAHDEFVLGLAPATASVFSLRRSEKPALRDLASPREYVQKEFNALGEDERVRETRGMMVDFALVSGMWAEDGDDTPRATVCTIGSNVCRLSPVALGWERAFGRMSISGLIVEKDKGWVEVDNRDQVSPLWEAFLLF